ncbi:hypothetical protein ACHAW5_000207 [Stephanodiscus triporus]|uniref:Uncharacterized protein n=1 Tax=Stephanodiscus triporus TaxID=2934178 RepID=A0ABD3MLE4_9STRA
MMTIAVGEIIMRSRRRTSGGAAESSPGGSSSPTRIICATRRGGATALLARIRVEDPASEIADPGVENPYKNPDLLLSSSSSDSDSDPSSHLRVDPARLLAPRLRGTNIYPRPHRWDLESPPVGARHRRSSDGNAHNFLRAAGMTIRQMFAEEDGEDRFGRRRRGCSIRSSAHVRCVVGRAQKRSAETELEQASHGLVVYLKVEPDVIYDRIRGNVDRPLLSNSDDPRTLTRLIEERRGRARAGGRGSWRLREHGRGGTWPTPALGALHDFIDDNPPLG